MTTTITVGGPTKTVTTTTPGQNAKLTFSGTAGQRVAVSFSASSYGTFTGSLLRPDGSAQTSSVISGATGSLATVTLGSTGTYTILVDPSGDATGSVTVRAAPG